MKTATAWDRYWASGRGAACFADAEGNYRGRIHQVWLNLFNRIPDACRVLDIATGNLAVPLIGAGSGLQQGKRFEIHGVDSARVSLPPDLDSRLTEQIVVHARVAAERLPFEACFFDLVTGQYAIEYTDWSLVFAEIGRVLRPGGLLQFVSHSQRSTVAAASRQQLREVDWLLNEWQVVEYVSALVRTEIRGRRFDPAGLQSPEAGRAKQRWTAVAQKALLRIRQEQLVDGLTSKVMGNLGELYQHRHRYSPDVVLDRIGQVNIELAAHQSRLQALLDAALDDDTVERVRTGLADLGFCVQRSDVLKDSNGGELGHLFRARLEPADRDA